MIGWNLASVYFVSGYDWLDPMLAVGCWLEGEVMVRVCCYQWKKFTD